MDNAPISTWNFAWSPIHSKSKLLSTMQSPILIQRTVGVNKPLGRIQTSLMKCQTFWWFQIYKYGKVDALILLGCHEELRFIF